MKRRNMNSLFRMKNLIRCCQNCVCATKIEKNIIRIPIDNIEKKEIEKEYKDLRHSQLQCDLYKTHIIKEFLRIYIKNS